MKKLKNEQQLLKLALTVGETYAKNRGYGGFTDTMAVRSLVAHLVWVQGVAGSNPVSPTTFPVKCRFDDASVAQLDRATAF